MILSMMASAMVDREKFIPFVVGYPDWKDSGSFVCTAFGYL